MAFLSFYLEKPWPELCDHSYGRMFGDVTINFWDLNFIQGLAATRPLIETGFVTLLPQIGESLHEWDYPELNLPSFPSPYLELGDITKEKIVEQVLYQLYLDNVVSSRLGCMHLYPSSSIDKISINGTPSWNVTSNQPAAYALLKLKIPYIRNLNYEEIARLKEDEYDHFRSFRDGIRLALNEMSEEIDSTSNLDLQIAKIQRDFIDEPLTELESRLTRLTKYQTYRTAGYTIASISLLFASSFGGDVLKISTQAIGTISLLKVFENLVDYLEKNQSWKVTLFFTY